MRLPRPGGYDTGSAGPTDRTLDELTGNPGSGSICVPVASPKKLVSFGSPGCQRVVWNARYFEARPLTVLIVGGSGRPDLGIPHAAQLMQPALQHADGSPVVAASRGRLYGSGSSKIRSSESRPAETSRRASTKQSAMRSSSACRST